MPKRSSILVFSDNPWLLNKFIDLIVELELFDYNYAYACSVDSPVLQDQKLIGLVKPLKIKDHLPELLGYNLIISAHSKQLFPAELVNAVRCINIHPGLNPHNRGWFPQVFSILNGKPLGATIHVMDEQIDHGAVIVKSEVPLYAYDTSLTAYNRVLNEEVALLKKYLPSILDGKMQPIMFSQEGNYNGIKDYKALLEIDLNQQLSFKEAIDKLRALSHPPYDNAYFIDPSTGKKIGVRIDLKPLE